MPMYPVRGEQDVTEPSCAPLARKSLCDGAKYCFSVFQGFSAVSKVVFGEKKLYFETLKPGCSAFAFLEMSRGCMFITVNNGVGYRCVVLLGVRAAPSVKYPFRKNVFTHILTVRFQVGASRLLRTLQLQSSCCEILDSLSAEALPDLLIFIHSIHTPVTAYMLQIFLIWKLLRFMTPLAVYLVRSRRLCNQLTLKKKAQIITVQILSCIVTICCPLKRC